MGIDLTVNLPVILSIGALAVTLVVKATRIEEAVRGTREDLDKHATTEEKIQEDFRNRMENHGERLVRLESAGTRR